MSIDGLDLSPLQGSARYTQRNARQNIQERWSELGDSNSGVEADLLSWLVVACMSTSITNDPRFNTAIIVPSCTVLSSTAFLSRCRESEKVSTFDTEDMHSI